MVHTRVRLLVVFGLAPAIWVPAFAQSVVSIHSGVLHFFDGTVYIGDQRQQQKFGRFAHIPEGRELRTEQGRAEVLLTPGVFLRIDGNSSIRMVSQKFSDTRVDFIGGSATLESKEPAPDTAVTVIHRDWQIRLPHAGFYRIDSQPPQVTVYKGEAEVSAEGKPETVAVRQSQILPLASVLVPERSVTAAMFDDFRSWATSRSLAVSSDNATAAGIIDDPTAIESASMAIGGVSYFPLTGIPGLAVTKPYGLSFWSPFQSTLSSIYSPWSSYGSLYPAYPLIPSSMIPPSMIPPSIIRYPLWPSTGTVINRSPVGTGVYSGGVGIPSRSPYSPPAQLLHPVGPHAGPHPGAAHGGAGHR